MLFNKSNEQCLGIKGFEPLNIRTKNEGLTNLAIFHQCLDKEPKILRKDGIRTHGISRNIQRFSRSSL